jgi:outer membrane protein TolC
MIRPLLRLLAALGVTAPLGAQATLSLAEAFGRADAGGYQNRIALSQARQRRAQAGAALQGILPTVRLTSGYARTDDPLGAFGFSLQQGGVTAASFDPARLNNPTPVSNWSSGLTAELPIFNADAWLGRSAAARAADASDASARWARESTRLQIVRAYFGAILAGERVQTLAAALEAATAHVRQAESLVDNGMATPSDALLAKVQRGRVEAQLIAARGDSSLAHRQLALVIGEFVTTGYSLPDSLPGADRIRGVVEAPSAEDSDQRADLSAARLGVDAARTDVRRATATMLPRVNAFGKYDWNSPDAPFDGQGRYTVGVMASWTPFAGGAQLAERSAALARADGAVAMAEAAEATAALERQSAATELEVAIAQLDIAELAVLQGADAHRIVARKYTGGLATVAELLSAAAVETETRLGRASARYQAIVAAATLRRATGANLMHLTALEN